MTKLTHHFATLNRVRLHYVTQGQGPLLILLHGFPAYWYCWSEHIPILAKNFTVVAPDMRGYNLSDKPGRVKDYQIHELAADVVGLIDALGHEKAYLVGHDWGGGVAWQTAASYPGRIERLAVLNCPHPTAFARELRKNATQRRRSWYMAFFQLPWIPELLIRWRLNGFLDSVFRPRRAFSAKAKAQYGKALGRPGALTAALNYYRAAGRASISSQKLDKIICPTALLWGERDSALGIELSQGLEYYVSGPYRRIGYPDCGHWPLNEKPQEVAQDLLDFLMLPIE